MVNDKNVVGTIKISSISQESYDGMVEIEGVIPDFEPISHSRHGSFLVKHLVVPDPNADIPSLYPRSMIDYSKLDCDTLHQIIERRVASVKKSATPPKIKNVIFNDPATIVFWSDDTKTVVKTQKGDVYDPEKGLAMAISKKYSGNDRDYYIQFEKWLKKYYKKHKEN